MPGIDTDGLSLPKRQTPASAGYDLCAAKVVEIAPGDIVLVPTGVRVRMPDDEYLVIYPRSSLAVKRRLALANAVGIIDADYYGNEGNGGQIFVPILNFGQSLAIIERSERIAQGIFQRYSKVDEESTEFVKRTGGFGSTG